MAWVVEMKKIWKFVLPIESKVAVPMPRGAQILSVQTQRSQICLWALVNPEATQQARIFEILGTGFDIEDGPQGTTRKHLGTVQFHGTPLGTLAWHIFERVPLE